MNSRIAHLNNMISEARTAAPQRSEGRDRSNTVTVILGIDNLPHSIRVTSGWQRQLQPAGFGGAVMEAAQVAAGRHGEAWMQNLGGKRWQETANQVPRDPATPPPLAAHRDVDLVAPRPLDVLAEDILQAMEQRNTSPEPAQGVGTAANGRLRVTLTPWGLSSCEADARWVSTQASDALEYALNQALNLARIELDKAVTAAKSAPGPNLDALISEALSHLTELTHPTDFPSEGGTP